MSYFLLVDDHSIVRSGLKQLIEDYFANCVIDEAQDGDSAFEKIKRHDYDLIMMDVNMPNTDSFGLLDTIYSYKPATKIIMFSMNSEEIFAKRYLKMGAMGYLRKDANGDEIKKAIETVLGNRKYISAGLTEKLLLDFQAESNPENPFDKLSPREFEIAQHLCQGESLSKISQTLHLHTSTVGTHKARIFDKLQCHNIIEMNDLGRTYGIIFKN
ncbi:MAG: response regulator transcription factor [Ginsengibacter sp.]